MTVVVVALVLASRWRPVRHIALAGAVGIALRSVEPAILAFDALLGASVGCRLVARQRRKSLRERLPEFADAVAQSLQRRRSMAEAVRSSSSVAPAAAPVLAECGDLLDRGLAPSDALTALRDHPDPEMRFVGAAVELASIQLSDAHLTMADAARSLRERRLRRHDIASQAAQATASSVVLALLPWAGLALSVGTGGDAHGALAQPGSQRLMALAGVGLSLAGTRWSLYLIERTEVLA